MRRHDRARHGFSLTELTVVLAIIAILVAMSAAAVSKYITVQQTTNTEHTIRKVYSKLMSQWEAVITAASKEDMDKTVGSAIANSIRTTAASDEARARVIYVKLRLKQEFPISYSEALAPTPLPAKQAYYNAFNAKPGGAHESSACLLASLRQGRGGIKLSADDLGTTSVKNIGGVDVLIDGWGTPLGFYRWPTGNTELDALAAPPPVDSSGLPSTNPSVVRDRQDPLGKLCDLNWYASSGGANKTQFETWCHSITKSGSDHAYYLEPVVVSAGPDLTLGLSTPDMMPNGTLNSDNKVADTDNIYSFRLLRVGARGD